MKVLICIRQLPYAEPTARFGGFISNLEDAFVTLMTVVERPEDISAAELGLRQASELIPSADVAVKIRVGEVVQEIIEESRDESYDIVVVGSYDAFGFLRALLGTIAGKIADLARSSVLVVREDRPKLKRILIPVGGQQMNRDVLKAGSRLAKIAGASVTVLYVTNPVPTMYTGLDAIDESLEELLQTDTPIAQHLHWSAQYLADQGLEAVVKMAQGVASDEILREARHGDYDLLVIGARSIAGGFLRKLVIDQVTPHVIERAPCSVLVIR